MRRLLLLLTLFVFAFTVNAHAVTPQNETSGKAYFIIVNGVITSATDKFIALSLDEAVENGAEVFVIKLNTPGGVLDSTRNIVQTIFESPIPVAVYVSPQGAQAASAGTFITLAADFAVMAEGSNIGAAHPVMITGGDIEGDMREKATNDTVSFMKSIAEKRGRNVEEAMLAVSESKSFTASEALRAGLIDGVVNNDSALLLMLETSLEMETPLTMHTIEPTSMQKFLFALSNPNILMLLFLIGAVMIFLEVKMPGTFVFGGIGVIALIFFLIGANFIPINFLGILLILLGIGLLIAEIFITSFGLLSLGGIISMVIGVMLTFDTAKSQGVSVSLWLVIVLVVLVAAIVVFIGRLIMKDMGRKPAVGLASIVGKTGRVISWNGRSGKVYVFGEIWDAVSRSALNKDEPIVVTDVKDMVITVAPVDTNIGSEE